jgi:hypothetical protein
MNLRGCASIVVHCWNIAPFATGDPTAYGVFAHAGALRLLETVSIFISKTTQKKVEFFTRKPTKLDLHFSDLSTIFNDFSKLHPKS